MIHVKYALMNSFSGKIHVTSKSFFLIHELLKSFSDKQNTYKVVTIQQVTS